MYSVSANYRAKILASGVRQRRITGTIGSVAFTSEDILKDSLSYTNQMAKGADISLGGVFVGTMKLTFMRSFSDRIPRKTWRGKIISISVGLLVDEDNDVWEDVPLGVFEIDNAEHTTMGVDVVAYDYMPRFDKTLYINESSGYPYDFLNYCCQQCRVQLGMTRADVQALSNGSEYLAIYPENDMQTYRDMISYISAVLGGYATINRAGKLEIRSFRTTADLQVNRNQRADGGRWCDFETTYTGVSVVRMEDQYVRNYGSQTGLTMKLGSNPFLQYGTDAHIQEMCLAIVESLSRFDYTPFTCSSFIDPAIDLGDIIDYTQGLAGTLSKGMVMKISYSFNKGIKLEGFGKNPALFGAQSKTDKNIAGIMSKENSGKDRISIVTFTNVTRIGIDDDWEQLAKLRIGVMEAQNVMLHGVVKTNLEEAGTVYIRYKLNGDYMPFIHACQFPIGEDTITLFLPVPVSNEFVNDLILEIRSDEGIGYIDIDNAKICLQGVGVTTGDWDGLIQIPEDEEEPETYSFPIRAGLGWSYSDDTPVLTTNPNALNITGSDSYSFQLQAGLGFTYSETQNTRITTESISYKLTTEDGLSNLATEDGLYNIVTEE